MLWVLQTQGRVRYFVELYWGRKKTFPEILLWRLFLRGSLLNIKFLWCWQIKPCISAEVVFICPSVLNPPAISLSFTNLPSKKRSYNYFLGTVSRKEWNADHTRTDHYLKRFFSKTDIMIYFGKALKVVFLITVEYNACYIVKQWEKEI